MRRFRKHLTRVGGVTAFIAFALASVGAEPGAAERDGSFEVVPYLWVAGIELETSLPSLPPSTPNVDRFDTRISAGAMLAAQVRYRSVGLFVDAAWLRLEFKPHNPVGDAVKAAASGSFVDWQLDTWSAVPSLELHFKNWPNQVTKGSS